MNGLLREGCAKVIDASKLGKRLSSEIWNSFGAIQVEDSFTYPSIDTKTVADGSSTLKICQFFVACSKCFSVFKYDGHAYGTTGLVKHVKICQGTNQNSRATSNQTSFTSSSNTNFDHSNIDNNTAHTTTSSSQQSVPNNNNTVVVVPINQTAGGLPSSATINNNATTSTTPTTTINGPVATRRRREPSSTPTKQARQAQQPLLRHLAKVIEELRSEQAELRQEQAELRRKVNELITMMLNGTLSVSHFVIDGDKVEDELQKTD